MSDMPRHHWTARKSDGSRLGSSAISLCAYLWSFLHAKARGAGGFVFHSADRLAVELDVDKRTIERQLRELREAALIAPGRDSLKRAGFVLLVLPESEIADRSAARSPIDLPQATDRSVGDRRSICRRSPIDLSEIADTFCSSKEEQEQEQEQEQEREQDLKRDPGPLSADQLLTQARALAAAALTPDGAPPLGTTRPALRTLIALLVEGEDPVRIERVLRRAGDIVAAGLERAAYFGAEMFIGRIWEHWCRSLFDLEQREGAELATRAQREAAAQAAEAARLAQVEAAALEADRDAVRLLLHRISRATERGPVEAFRRALAERDPVEAALIYAPEAAQQAATKAHLEAGDKLTEAALIAALVALEVKPPSAATPEPAALTPADLRAARERAAREGRSVFEYLDQPTRG
jgi:hypothetical protein